MQQKLTQFNIARFFLDVHRERNSLHYITSFLVLQRSYMGHRSIPNSQIRFACDLTALNQTSAPAIQFFHTHHYAIMNIWHITSCVLLLLLYQDIWFRKYAYCWQLSRLFSSARLSCYVEKVGSTLLVSIFNINNPGGRIESWEMTSVWSDYQMVFRSQGSTHELPDPLVILELQTRWVRNVRVL